SRWGTPRASPWQTRRTAFGGSIGGEPETRGAAMNTTMIRERLAGQDGQAPHPRPAAGEPPTDAVSAVVEVHVRVERAFALYDQAEGSNRQRYRALLAIADELAAHTAVEEELLSPALRARPG